MSTVTRKHQIWTACQSLSRTQATFTMEDIAVACFVAYPDDFRMRDHNYPDTRKLSVYLSGPQSLLKTGALIKATKSTYALGAEPPKESYPRHGRPIAVSKALPKYKTDKPDTAWLNRILQSTLAKKLKGELKGDIGQIDAMQVLGIKRISGLGQEALKTGTAKLRALEIHQSADQAQINFAHCILNKITPIVDRLDKVSKHGKSNTAQDEAAADVA